MAGILTKEQPMLRIETERLLIRPFTMDDVEAIYHVLDIDLKFGTLPRDEREEWVRWSILNEKQLAKLFQPPYGDRPIVLKTTNTVIGAIGYVPCLDHFGQLPYFSTRLGKPVDRDHRTAEVGLYWAIASEHQRKGYAAEAARGMIDWAFENLKLKRIVATTEYKNEASMGVMRRVGMTIERNPYPDPFWLQVVGVLENPDSG
jgi:[ribosomal protein S5]-alanine N-acetyltransferase